jgi:hypothetical protein
LGTVFFFLTQKEKYNMLSSDLRPKCSNVNENLRF